MLLKREIFRLIERALMNRKKFETKNPAKKQEIFVGGTGFEPATSAMSTQRSKPTELTALKEKTSDLSEVLWVLRDSNPRPSGCKPDALNQLS